MIALALTFVITALGFSGDTTVLTPSHPDISIDAGEFAQIYGCSGANRIDIGAGAHVEMLHMPGANTISINADSSIFSVSQSGSMVTFQGEDGTIVKLPATSTLQNIVFNDGEAFLGVKVLLGEQQVTQIPSAVNPMGDSVFPDPSGHQAGDTWTEPVTGMEFVWIPPGNFIMGSPNDSGGKEEHPQHEVTLTKGFWMGKYEVTQGQWKQIMNNTNPSYFKKNGIENSDNWPVDSIAYASKSTPEVSITGEGGFLHGLKAFTGLTFSLPTEAQWEYAARGGVEGQAYPGSLNNVDAVCWYRDNSGNTTHEVGQKQPNAWGLYDMSGNIAELCKDKYYTTYYKNSPSVDPVANGNGTRVIRGGSYKSHSGWVRSAARGSQAQAHRRSYLGFRLVLNQP